jgi:hypothetical protein
VIVGGHGDGRDDGGHAGRAVGRAVRRALAAAGTAAALLQLALGWRLGDRGPAGAALDLLAAAPPVLLLPSAVRVLAHPRPAPPPAASTRAAVAGTAAALCCLTGALLLALVRAVAPLDVVALAVLAASVGGTAVSATLLLRARTPRQAPLVPVRPDLLDDVTTLVARALPGSVPARAADRLNRRVDAWWGPARGVPAPAGYGRTTVAAASPDAADTVTLAPPLEGTASVAAGARATTA